MLQTALTISAQPFDSADWGPYGWVPVPDTDPRDKALRKQRLREGWRRVREWFGKRGAAAP